jgi:hypothetical protein
MSMKAEVIVSEHDRLAGIVVVKCKRCGNSFASERDERVQECVSLVLNHECSTPEGGR